MIDRRFLFAFLVGLLALAGTATAQLRVDLSLRRSLFIRYEPVIATVTITNLSGREIELTDDGNHKWFSFTIESASGALVPPYNADYSLQPVRIGVGERLTRAVNVTPLYPITEYGVYRLRATVYDASANRYFGSPPLNVEITEGRVLWQQTVGVPASEGSAGGTRHVTLLSHRLPDQTQLYVRIEDKANGLIFCTSQLGRIVSFDRPSVELDGNNDVHILQNVAPRKFLYTKMSLNGKVADRQQFMATEQSRPQFVRGPGGAVQIVGGVFMDPKALEAQKAAPTPPSASSRPVPLPKSE